MACEIQEKWHMKKMKEKGHGLCIAWKKDVFTLVKGLFKINMENIAKELNDNNYKKNNKSLS